MHTLCMGTFAISQQFCRPE